MGCQFYSIGFVRFDKTLANFTEYAIVYPEMGDDCVQTMPDRAVRSPAAGDGTVPAAAYAEETL